MSYDATILATAGLVHYWKLDEASGTSAADAVGSDALTIAGGVTLSSAPLVSGGTAAMTFARASSGRASRGSSYGATSASYECWFRSSDAATDRQCLLFNGSGTNGFGLFINGGAVNGHLYYLRQNVGWHDTAYIPATWAAWPHHLVLTLDGSGFAKVYVDGLLTITVGAAPNAPTAGFVVGAETASGTNGFGGTIDDVAVYSATLTAATVLEHYQAGIAYRSTSRAKPASPTWQAGRAPAGCKLYVPMADAPAATLREMATRTLATWFGSPDWGSGPYGPQLGGFATAKYVDLFPSSQVLGANYPFWWATLASNSSTAAAWAFTQGDGPVSPAYNVSLSYNPGTIFGRLDYILHGTSADINIEAYGLPLSDGRPHVAMGWSHSATDHHLAFDGIEVASGTTNPGTITGSRIALGVHINSLGGTSEPFGGSLIAFLAGNGSVPDPVTLAEDLLSGDFSAVRPRMPLALLSIAAAVTFRPRRKAAVLGSGVF